MTRIITLVSFGYGFFEKDPDPSIANHIEDVRGSLRNPYMVRDHPELLELDGRHPDLQQFVLATPGAPELLDELFRYITEETKGFVRIAIGCKAGRHRSVALIELLAKRLREAGYTVNIEHIHLENALANKPLLRK